MAESSRKNGFSYQGYLIFNEIFETRLSRDSEFHVGRVDNERRIPEKLQAAQRTSSPLRKRVRSLPFGPNDERSSEEYGDILEDIESLVPLRFFYEERIETEGYLPGENRLRELEIPTEKDADVYWMYPNRMFFRGSEKDVTEAVEFITESMDARVIQQSQDPIKEDASDEFSTDGGTNSKQSDSTTEFSSVSFSGDFLLWLFYMYFTQTQLPAGTDIEMSRLTDAEVTGDVDVWGGNNRVSDSVELAESPPLLSSILQNKHFKMIEGGFDLSGSSVRSAVQVNKVHIKASVGDIQTADPKRRMALSLTFLQELVDLHQHWRGLTPTDRYPEHGFFLDLFDRCEDHGMTLDHISRTLRRRYCDLRGESDRTWRL